MAEKLTNAVLIVPDYVSIGETVPVKVIIENLSGQSQYVLPQVGAAVAFEQWQKTWYGDYYLLAPHEKKQYLFSFIMPDVTPSPTNPNRDVHINEFTFVYPSVTTGYLDSMSLGRSVRIMPPNPYYTVRIANPPSNIHAWYFQYMQGIYGVQSAIMNPGTVFYCAAAPLSGEVTYRIIIYDEYQNYIQDIQGPITIVPGGEYVYDCTTKTLRGGGPLSSQIAVSLAAGESKAVSFEVIPYEAKVYQVSVDGLTGSFSAR